mmetsp:Transcript_7857/g.23282  ORF Transcript_7857/g.23282 Transcript_7857/m.23282 type:complete len:218 (+) Transcript_7857:901-1554(+)
MQLHDRHRPRARHEGWGRVTKRAGILRQSRKTILERIQNETCRDANRPAHPFVAQLALKGHCELHVIAAIGIQVRNPARGFQSQTLCGQPRPRGSVRDLRPYIQRVLGVVEVLQAESAITMRCVRVDESEPYVLANERAQRQIGERAPIVVNPSLNMLHTTENLIHREEGVGEQGQEHGADDHIRQTLESQLHFPRVEKTHRYPQALRIAISLTKMA